MVTVFNVIKLSLLNFVASIKAHDVITKLPIEAPAYTRDSHKVMLGRLDSLRHKL